MSVNSEPLTNSAGKLLVSKTYTIVLDASLFAPGVYVPGTATISPPIFEPSEDFLGSLIWEKKNEILFVTNETTLPINVVVSGFDRPYVFNTPTVIFRSGIKGGKIVHDCLIVSKPGLSYKLLKEGAAGRVAGDDPDEAWGNKDRWGNMRRAAGTRGGRRKQKRHRRTLRKSRRNHRTK